MMSRKTSIKSLSAGGNALTSLPLTTLSFPEIHLETRDAHKLRGYFGNLFREHSPLLHNHFQDGSSRYAYPLVQYKVLRNVPTLIGLGDGANLLAELFLKTKELNIEGEVLPLYSKEIKHNVVHIGITTTPTIYRFETLWMALNQKNFSLYLTMDKGSKASFLNRILTANILSFFKSFGLYLNATERIIITFQEQEKSTKFKDKTMIAFYGEFTANVLLPDLIGLGKSVSRGFGTIQQIS